MNYYYNHQEKLREYKKAYYQENKHWIKEDNKKYKEQNKEWLKEDLLCECGSSVKRENMWRHMRTKKHQKYIMSLDNE